MRHGLFLLDASIWVSLSRRRVSPLRARVSELVQAQTAAVNSAVRLEVLIGSRDQDDFARNEAEFAVLVELPITDDTWSRATSLGFRLRRQGITTGVPDLLIAASAIEHQAVLVHADSDFDRIAAQSELAVESYVSLLEQG